MSAGIGQSLKVGIIAIILLVAHLSGFAATYYVDYSAGADSASGSATGTAWKHCPGDPNATGNANVALQSGDVVAFNGGVNYVLVSQGISTFFGITYTNYGTGKPVFTDNFSSSRITAFGNSSGITNCTFANLSFYQIGGSNSLPADPSGTGFAPNGIPAKLGYGIKAGSIVNTLISGCYFGQLGYYQQTGPLGNPSLGGSGVLCSFANGLTVTNCELTQIRQPIEIASSGCWNTTIANCFFHDQCEWALTILCVNSYRSNLTICSCTFSNTDQYYVGTSQGGLWTGYGEGPHENAIMMFNGEDSIGNSALDRSPGDTNVFIYNNKFLTTMGHPGGTSAIWLQDSTSGYIYNNLFYLCAANNAISVSEFATNTPTQNGVYNNTFYGGNVAIGISGSIGGAPWAPVTTNTFIRLENNVISTVNIGNNNAFNFNLNTPTNYFNNYTNNILIDYNAYFSDQTSADGMVFGLWPHSLFNGGYPGYFVLNSAPSRAESIPPQWFGWNLHSVTMSSSLFVNPVHASPFNYDLHPQTGFSAVGTGVNLTSLNLPGLNTDLDGNPRPATGNWMMGAYQISSSNVSSPANHVTPPQQLRVHAPGQ
jgi:hypothetical protein